MCHDDILGKDLSVGSVSISPRATCLYMYMYLASHQSIYYSKPNCFHSLINHIPL